MGFPNIELNEPLFFYKITVFVTSLQKQKNQQEKTLKSTGGVFKGEKIESIKIETLLIRIECATNSLVPFHWTSISDSQYATVMEFLYLFKLRNRIEGLEKERKVVSDSDIITGLGKTLHFLKMWRCYLYGHFKREEFRYRCSPVTGYMLSIYKTPGSTISKKKRNKKTYFRTSVSNSMNPQLIS